MAKAGPMPTHQGLRSDDSDGPEHRWKPSIQQDQEQAIPICEPDATPHPALQRNQLMTERRVLGLKFADLWERAAIGPIPGGLVVVAGVLFHGAWAVLALVTYRIEIASRRERRSLIAMG